ncbi:carboxypeptidase-like regulatory domain-containing protein [Mesonia sp. MT50]|uniref:Carboxypeptidase-like regulatory domain-containing protein n=1 Tax=Mesonia profundi TaxID=3070998 RepID=A0ABU1A1Z5_9FLAO|nr:carboxypeptidase-like regulatory domain-containing protein [Mesonia profundi]MDQ7917654.1 carboxypeptidase-like regulatory domain-containing protein [Mesonia profundi]
MHRFHQTFILFFLLFSFQSYTQQSLSGTVTDSLDKPLSSANLLAVPKDSLQEVKFSITDNKGRYHLNLKSIPYTVTVNYMGYTKKEFDIKLDEDQSKNIILQEQAESLEEVVLEMPMVVKKDTIIYNVNKLVTGEERKLKDVLKKLPGVEVDKNGGITVNGKKVTTMLVENEKFLVEALN